MLAENIKQLRKQHGMTQEKFAVRLNVVRQTVSKWEKGLSVPDADLLEKIAEILETDVSTILGGPIKTDYNTNEISEHLSRINEQLATKARNSRRIWFAVGIIALSIILLTVIWIIVGRTTGVNENTSITQQHEIIKPL